MKVDPTRGGIIPRGLTKQWDQVGSSEAVELIKYPSVPNGIPSPTLMVKDNLSSLPKSLQWYRDF